MVAAVGAVITEVNTQTTKKILALAAIHRHFLSVILSCPAEKKTSNASACNYFFFFYRFCLKAYVNSKFQQK